MIVLRNKSGFTLIEVLLATALVGIVLGPIYMLQNTVFNQVVRLSQAVERMFLAYDFFLDVQKQQAAGVQQKRLAKTVQDPKTELIYEIKELSRNSVLSADFNHLCLEKVTWSWSVLGVSYDDVLVNIVFESPKKKKEPEEKEQPKEQKEPAKGNDNKKQTPIGTQPTKPVGGRV